MEGNKQEKEQDQELFEHYSYVADPKQSLLRIDKFLMDRIEGTSRTKIQAAALAGNILVNGKSIKSNYKVKPSDKISIVLPHPPKDTELIPQNIPLNIIYEDDDLLVVNKDAGMVVHPGFGNSDGTLVNALVYHFENLPSTSDLANRPGLVHRIDKNTSGLLVIAKTEFSMTHLAKQFFDRTVDRRYNALVWGDLKEEEGVIETNLGRSLKDRRIMDVFEYESEIGKHAITNYKLIQHFNYVSLVECKLQTGRTHQIRVHMKHIGHPLFNDIEYGGNKVLKGLPTANYRRFIQNNFDLIPGQALHARTLEFTHPVSGERLKFECDLPEGFQAILKRFETV